MSTRWLLSAALLFVAASASADGDWYRENNNTGNTTTSVAPKSGQQTAFYWIDAGSTTDSKPLATAACASITVEMVDSIAGGGTNEAEVYIRTTNTQSGLCSSGRKVLADIDGGGLDDVTLNGDHGADEDGDLTAEGRAFLWGFGPLPYLCVDAVVAPGTGDSAYIIVTCSGE